MVDEGNTYLEQCRFYYCHRCSLLVLRFTAAAAAVQETRVGAWSIDSQEAKKVAFWLLWVLPVPLGLRCVLPVLEPSQYAQPEGGGDK
jgi:hypothetical protein